VFSEVFEALDGFESGLPGGTSMIRREPLNPIHTTA
jgi:hypothetical protein